LGIMAGKTYIVKLYQLTKSIAFLQPSRDLRTYYREHKIVCLCLASVHPQVTAVGVILRSAATKNPFVLGFAGDSSLSQNDNTRFLDGHSML
jgi:hypothetical protein